MVRWCRVWVLAMTVTAGCGGSGFAVTETKTDAGLQACLTKELVALVGQDEAAARAIIPKLARIIPPNSAITQDYRPDRVNVDLDEVGIVTRVWCG